MSGTLLRATAGMSLLVMAVLGFAYPDSPADLLSKLEQAATGAERVRILDESRGAVNQDLFASLVKRFDEVVNGADYARSRHLAEAQIAVAERLGNREHIGQAYGSLGLALFRSEEFGAAAEAYRKSLAIGEELKDPVRIGQALNGIGLATRDGGTFEESMAAFDRAEQVVRQGSDTVLLARVLNNSGTTLLRNGELRRAAAKLQEALNIAEQRGERQGQSFVLNNLGNVFQQQGEHELALGYFRKSLEIKRQLGNKRDIVTTLSNVGLTEHYLGRDREGLPSLTAALALARELGMKRMIGTALNNRALLERELGEIEPALADFREALSIAEPTGDREMVPILLSSIAETEFALGRREEALPKMRRALELAREFGGRIALADVTEAAGVAMLRMGLLDEAEPVLREGMEAVESLRSEAPGGEVNSRGFLNRHLQIFQSLCELLVQRGQPAEALAIAERAKARVLVDVLRSGGRGPVTGALTSEEKDQERRLQAALSRASSRLLEERGAQARERRNAAGRELAAFQAGLYWAHPELKFQRAEFAPASVDQLGILLATRRAAMIEYVVAEDEVLAFVVRRDASNTPTLTVHTLPVKDKEVQALARKLRDGIASRGYGWRSAARRLYRILIEPAARDLKGASTLIVAPDGPLWQVPFATLIDRNNHYVVESTAVFYAPSLTALYESRIPKAPAGNSSVLAFANPDFGGKAQQLPDTEGEAAAIARLYGPARSKVYTGAQALESRMRAEAPRYSVLHLATHGTINDSNPLYSYLMMTADQAHGDDGLLEAREMLDLNLRAEVAVLSACDTARGTLSRGEGVIGMSWALLVAGASSTVVSHWRVDSASTAQFMVAFHRGLAETPGLSHKAQALRTAALDLLQSAEYRHPFYWAPFVLIGNGF